MSEQKAEELIRAAEKKMASGQGFFSSMFSDPNRKTEEAAELFKEAAIQFKIAKNYESSSNASTRAAELFEKLQARKKERKRGVERGVERGQERGQERGVERGSEGVCVCMCVCVCVCACVRQLAHILSLFFFTLSATT